MQSASERNAISSGAVFQFPAITFFMLTTLLYSPGASWESPWMFPSHVGSILFVYCLWAIYGRPSVYGEKTLLTEGPFKYTRHPMYTGFALMDASYWLPRPPVIDPTFIALQAGFFFCLIMAAWYQERETLARFGNQAEDYYARTPRLFFMYPFMRSHA